MDPPPTHNIKKCTNVQRSVLATKLRPEPVSKEYFFNVGVGANLSGIFKTDIPVKY